MFVNNFQHTKRRFGWELSTQYLQQNSRQRTMKPWRVFLFHTFPHTESQSQCLQVRVLPGKSIPHRDALSPQTLRRHSTAARTVAQLLETAQGNQKIWDCGAVKRTARKALRQWDRKDSNSPAYNDVRKWSFQLIWLWHCGTLSGLSSNLLSFVLGKGWGWRNLDDFAWFRTFPLIYCQQRNPVNSEHLQCTTTNFN